MIRSSGGSPTRRMRFAALGAGVLLASGALAACGGGDDGASNESGPIKIGMNAEVTGPVPALGKSVDGAKAAVKAINANGGIDGRKVELKVADSAGDPTRAVTNIRSFKSDGIDLVLAGTYISDCDAVAPFLTQRKMLGLCTSTGDLSADTAASEFGIGPSYTQSVAYSIDILAKQADSIGVLAEKNVSGDNTEQLALKAAKRNGVKVEVEQVDVSANSAKPQIQKLIADGAKALWFNTCSGIGATGPVDAQSLGFEGPILAPDCFASVGGEQALRGAAHGDQVRILVPKFVLGKFAADDPQADAIKAYQDAVGTRDVVVGAGWDAIMVLKAAIEKSGSADPTEVRKAFNGLKFTGVWSVGTFGDSSGRGGSAKGVQVLAKVTPKGFAPLPETD